MQVNPLSLAKAIRAVILGAGLFAALYFFAGRYLGPGLGDQSIPIIGGYEYDDAGGGEQAIAYRGDQYPHKIIIDARVDSYRVEGTKIFVARRPRVSTLAADGALDSRVLDICEYWFIDVRTHVVEQTKESVGVNCR